MKQFKPVILIIIISALFAGCANMHYRQGNRMYDNLGYNSAAVFYEKALDRKMIPDAQIKLADSYRKVNNYEKAESEYAKVIKLKEAKPEHKFLYAQALLKNGKCEEATQWFEEYAKENPNDQNAKEWKTACDERAKLMKDSLNYEVEKMKLSASSSDFSPVFYNDGLVFASERTEAGARNRAAYTGRPYLDLYYTKQDKDNKWSSPEPLKGSVNTKYHEGPSAFTPDAKTIYFTRNVYNGSKTKTDAEGAVNLNIYKATIENNEWKNVESLSFNSKEYSTGHPALSKDGNTMYFVSDMPGGFGGTDLYVSNLVNGNWSKPQNMGASVNSPGDEMTPFMLGDTSLYFSSNGHGGMGGLDVYSISKNGDQWANRINLGYPINSNRDDLGYVSDSTARMGYLSSNRTNDDGTDNLFRFVKKAVLLSLEGVVVDKISQMPIEGALVELLNNDTKKVETYFTGPDGKYSFKMDPFSSYIVSSAKDGYFTAEKEISAKGKNPSETMFVKLEMEKIVIDKPIVLENIYYDFDKSNIRTDAAVELDKLVKILKDNPGITIELSSHTDSRASDDYNMKLSQKRAESATTYIVSKGIEQIRIVAKGYGESKLVNRCKNGVPCSEVDHQQNRRTEFKVTRIDPNGKIQIYTSSPSTSTGMEQKKNSPGPIGEIWFSVQVASSVKRMYVDNNKFKSISQVREEKDDGAYKYLVGKTRRYSEAQALKDDVVQKGFKDAFIVAYQNSKRITITEGMSSGSEE